MTGQEMYDFAADLYPMPRSLTGYYTRQTLIKIACELPGLTRHTAPSGSEVFDWTVPPEWSVEQAALLGPDSVYWPGGAVCEWTENPLHLVGYSVPVVGEVGLSELREHLYTAPGAIPYVTSYYNPSWGFCLSEEEVAKLPEGHYRVEIDTRLDEHGELDYADLVIPGKSKDEVLFSTYVCHPNLANDNVSGMVVQAALAQWIASDPRRYTYRFVYAPETIGSLVYLSRHLNHLKGRVVAGFVLTCLGDGRPQHQMSRTEGTLADRVANHSTARHRSWLDRGSDERQWNAPNVDLPVVSFSKDGNYPEYHTSADDMTVISPEGLKRGLDTLKRCVRVLEHNRQFRSTCIGEPNLGKRGLYPTTSHGERPRELLDVLSYCDGDHDLIDVCDRTGMAPESVIEAINKLEGHGLLARAT